jgi:hypothetical protein
LVYNSPFWYAVTRKKSGNPARKARNERIYLKQREPILFCCVVLAVFSLSQTSPNRIFQDQLFFYCFNNSIISWKCISFVAGLFLDGMRCALHSKMDFRCRFTAVEEYLKPKAQDGDALRAVTHLANTFVATSSGSRFETRMSCTAKSSIAQSSIIRSSMAQSSIAQSSIIRSSMAQSYIAQSSID